MTVDLKKNVKMEHAFLHVNWYHVEEMPNVNLIFTLPNVFA